MGRDEALARLAGIVNGIDATEGGDRCEDAEADLWTRTDTEGWWETSAGAAFGAGVLRDLQALVRDLT